MKNDIHDLALVACWVSSTKRHVSPMSEGCRTSSVGWVSARVAASAITRADQQVLLDCIRAISPLSVVMAEALGNRRAVRA